MSRLSGQRAIRIVGLVLSVGSATVVHATVPAGVAPASAPKASPAPAQAAQNGIDAAAARVLAALRQAHPGTRFDSVTSTPITGVYQVKMGSNYAYVGAGNTRHMVFGRLFDIRSLRDLTPASAEVTDSSNEPAPAPVRFKELPLADAIKEVHGSGTRRMVLFSDPQCPYCRRLDGELGKLKDVTIYTFVVPFQGEELPLAVWCTSDRLAAWRAAMAGTLAPAEGGKCANPLERNRALAGRLGVQGTPTMLFEDGKRIGGYAGAPEIDTHLSRSNP